MPFLKTKTKGETRTPARKIRLLSEYWNAATKFADSYNKY